MVHDARTGSLHLLDRRAFELLKCADGTRDHEGIVLAAMRAGAFRKLEEIEMLLGPLDQAGLLAEGIEAPGQPAESRPEASRPLRSLPGFQFGCDGTGACCRQYASVAFTADDADRARRVGLATTSDDLRAERLFLPLVGMVRSERMAMTLVDGQCLQLEASGKCGLHARGGPESKPVGCRVFPATLVDDGSELRASVAVECDCVVTSAVNSTEDTPGTGLVDPTWQCAGDLPAGLTVRSLPEMIVLSEGRSAARSNYVSWADGAALSEDAIDACLELARELDPKGEADALARHVTRLAEVMQSAAAAADAWRSERDRTRRIRSVVASAAAAVAARGVELVTPSAHAPLERFALRAALFGHQLAGEVPVAEGLHGLGAKLLIAREVASSGPKDLGHALPLVMAAVRGTV